MKRKEGLSFQVAKDIADAQVEHCVVYWDNESGNYAVIGYEEFTTSGTYESILNPHFFVYDNKGGFIKDPREIGGA